MEKNVKKIKSAQRIFAIIGLIFIAFCLIIMIYGIIIQNGMLSFTMIFVLIFFSILFWIAQYFTKIFRNHFEINEKAEEIIKDLNKKEE